MYVSVEELKSLGCIPTSFKCIKLNSKCLSVSEAQEKEWSEDSDWIVTVDNPVWIATRGGVPLFKASAVMSSDGITCGLWEKESGSLFLSELRCNKLVTIQQINVKKEKMIMADVKKFDESELADIFGENDGSAVVPPKPITSFSDVDTPKIDLKIDDDKKDKEITKSSIKKEEEMRIKSDISSVALANNDEAILLNQEYGRALGFITKTDPVIKCVVKDVLKKGPNGEKILTQDADQSVRDRYNKEGKVAAAYCEKEKTLVLQQTKPAAPVLMVIATPEGGDTSLSEMSSEGIIKAGKDTTLIVRFMSMELAYEYLAFNYQGSIKESDKLLGNKACWLEMQTTKATVKENDKDVTVLKNILRIRKGESRKSLLTTGNFFPVEVFETIPLQDLSAKNKELLNLNIEAALKKAGTYEKLNKESKDIVTVAKNGSGYTSKWFDNPSSVSITAFDNSDQALTTIMMPTREKKPTKDGSSYTYRFKRFKLVDEEHGPLSTAQYKDFVALTGKTNEEFIAEIQKLTGSNNRNKNTSILTPEDFLRAKLAKKYVSSGAKTTLELQKELKGLQ